MAPKRRKNNGGDGGSKASGDGGEGSANKAAKPSLVVTEQDSDGKVPRGETPRPSAPEVCCTSRQRTNVFDPAVLKNSD
jgi:hypothetical protein